MDPIKHYFYFKMSNNIIKMPVLLKSDDSQSRLLRINAQFSKIKVLEHRFYSHLFNSEK